MAINNFPYQDLNNYNLDWVLDIAGETENFVKVTPQEFTEEEKEIARANIGASASGAKAVLYEPQELTSEQKAQARANIGVGGGESSVLYTPQTLTDEEQAQARENISAKDAAWMPTAEDIGAVPDTRTVNGKSLANDISLTASDVSAVPRTRTVNGKALTGNITLNASDVNAVPTSRSVNSKALSGDIVLNADDVGARASTWMPTAAETGALPVAFSDVVSDAWSETATYNVGDYCIFANQLWKCKTQHSGVVPVEGAYWTIANVTSELKSSGSALKQAAFSVTTSTYGNFNYAPFMPTGDITKYVVCSISAHINSTGTACIVIPYKYNSYSTLAVDINAGGHVISAENNNTLTNTAITGTIYYFEI